MKKLISRPIPGREKSQAPQTNPEQTQEEMEEEEPFHISTYLTREDWERPFTPEEEAENEIFIAKLTKKLQEEETKRKATSNTNTML